MNYLFGILLWMLALIGAYAMAGFLGLAIVFVFFFTLLTLNLVAQRERQKKAMEHPLAYLALISLEAEKWEKEHNKELARKGITRVKEDPEGK